MACSDGLTGMVDDRVLAEVLAHAANGGELAQACAHLVELANEAGGDDNVTVVMARCR
jgi:serine/threonine protein phosphatase PrpC